MKVLLTGGKGMLGRTLCSELREFEMIPTDLPEADITDAAGFDAACRAHSPDVVIHCAAMTAVDKCETEKELAWKLNAVGSSNVAAACHRQGIRLIAISTDYVFSGDAQEPYTEFSNAQRRNKCVRAEQMGRRAGYPYALPKPYHCENFLAVWSGRTELCAYDATACRWKPRLSPRCG